MVAKKKPTQAERIRRLLDAGASREAARAATGASRQAVDAAAAARGARGRPAKLEGGESVRLYLSRPTLEWLRAAAAHNDCSIGEIVEAARRALEAADAQSGKSSTTRRRAAVARGKE